MLIENRSSRTESWGVQCLEVMEMCDEQRRMRRSSQLSQREVRGVECLQGLDKKIFQKGSSSQLHRVDMIKRG